MVMLSLLTVLRSFSVKVPRLQISSCRLLSSDIPSLVTCNQSGGIRNILLNNPFKRNALSLSMLESLKDHLARDSRKLDLRLIIISSSGPIFCSGHDLKELLSKDSRLERAHIFKTCSDVMELIQDLPVPVICKVDGLAAAAGCQLVASCDIVIATDRSRFSTPGVDVGLFCSTPAVALSRTVPRKLALEMLFTGMQINAQKALENGLVNKVVPCDQLDIEVEKICENILAKSRAVLAIGKAAFYRQIVKDRNSAYQDASDIMVENMSLHDGREGVAAFLRKEKAKWDHSLD